MGILLWIIFGGTDAEQGIMLNIVVGIVGAVVGGWLMSIVGSTGVTGFNLYSFLVAIAGAVVLIGVVRMVRRS
jgi:uncharacterized membrane protein YeaQ/YmgE (transglycosylase-associated protein family)